ncbi:hypothetical protein ALT785_160335 [Alteromonas infernus]
METIMKLIASTFKVINRTCPMSI